MAPWEAVIRSKLFCLIVTITAPIAWSLAASAQGSPTFEFRSHRIGEVLDPSIPKWEGCSGLCPDVLRKWQQGNKIFGSCKDASDSDVGIVKCDDVEATSKYAVGGVPIQGLSYRFFESKLYSLWMFVDVRHYSQIREMLVGNYGKPTREKASTVENRAGASFDDIITEWDFREGTLKLRYVQIDSSWLTFKNPTVEKQIRERRAAIDQQKGKSAF